MSNAILISGATGTIGCELAKTSMALPLCSVKVYIFGEIDMSCEDMQ